MSLSCLVVFDRQQKIIQIKNCLGLKIKFKNIDDETEDVNKQICSKTTLLFSADIQQWQKDRNYNRIALKLKVDMRNSSIHMS